MFKVSIDYQSQLFGISDLTLFSIGKKGGLIQLDNKKPL
jgi:hypothetical protein